MSRFRLIQLAQQLASGRCVPLSFCASITLKICQSAATSAATSATRAATSSPSPFVTPTAGPCPQERARGMFFPCTHPGKYRGSQIHNHRQSYNKANVNNSASQHWSYMERARGPNVQRQQHHPSVNASAPFVNQSVYPPRETNLGSHSIGGAGVLAAVSHHKL
jgi:hypothetical protein